LVPRAGANYQRTLADPGIPAPGWRRLSSPVFSPGTGSLLAEVVLVLLVEAQLLSQEIASKTKANIERRFIAAET
jgi:hypothetical protein